MGTITIATTFLLILNYGFSAQAKPEKNLLNSNTDNIENKKARDIISSFLNAWKTSKIIPDYGRENSNRNSNTRKFDAKHENFQLDKLDFLGHRKSELDGPALFALRNALNPRPVRKPKSRPSSVQAETFIGKDEVDEDDRSPELKLASLVSKPIYHSLPAGAPQSTEDDIKQFMFGNNGDANENNVGLPNDDWQASLNGRRSFVRIPGLRRSHEYLDSEDYERDNGHKRNSIIDNNVLEQTNRNLRDGIPMEFGSQQEVRDLFRQVGDKKELITDPYDSLSLPVSEYISGPENDRKFYKTLPDNILDEYETGQVPAQFKLQKNRLWGNIQKRWRRSKVNRKQNWPLQEEEQVKAVGRSLGDALGETGHTYDAYGEIGQGIEQSLMKLNGDKPGCSQNTDLNMAPMGMDNRGSNPSVFLDTAGLQQDDSKQSDNGIIQISPDGAHVRSSIHKPAYETLRNRILRNKRSVVMLQKKSLQEVLARKVKAAKRKLQAAKTGSTAASRSINSHYLGGMPDSRGTENEDGITEDNEHDNLDEKLSHDSTPLLMKIAQHDRDDMNKFWSNKHSPGNGFYTGHGEGPNHAYLGDYFGHGPDEMLHDDGIKSLEESASPEDHHTASLIDSIWEHDLGEDRLGEHRVERHHGGLKIKNYFGGHHSPSIMLPTETLDGIDTHWTGHIPHVHTSDYSHNDGHPIDFSPTRIKAIQAIQDDPAIDAELNPHDGIGIAMGHGHHISRGYHHGEGHSYGGMNLAPVISDPVHVEDSHEEEYKQHIDNLLSQYHGLEEHLRGTDGTLAGHMDPGAMAHHGSHHLHTGYDLYAYKNPWENMKIPYHVPVINHPAGEEEEPPPSPLSFEGKTDEKGNPMIEGGKEEGGKGGPLVEGSKALAEKGGKGKGGESPKGAKSSGSKSPMPVIPKQRGGPEVSKGKNETEKEGKEKEAKEAAENKEAAESDKEQKEEKSTANDIKEKEKEKASEESKDNQETTKQKEVSGEVSGESKEDKEKGDEEKGKEEQEDAEKSLTSMVEKMMNSTGKQTEMLNNLKTALGDEAKNPKSVAALQLAKLKQLGSMQQALLSSLAKQTSTKKVKESGKSDTEGAGLSDIKQLIELQSLQQLGAGLKANALVNAVRQSSLLQSLKTAQENILKNIKTHSALLDNGVLDKPEVTGSQTSDIQKFFGKIPVRLFGSDLGNVGSEKIASRSRQALGTNTVTDANNIGDLLHTMHTAHLRKQQPATKGSNFKPMLTNLLSESLLKTMKNKIKHSMSRSGVKENKEASSSDKAYSQIGNEGPTTAAEEEQAHRRTTHVKDKKKESAKVKHKKPSEEKEVNESAVEKAEIIPFHEKDFEEDVVSKKDEIKPH